MRLTSIRLKSESRGVGDTNAAGQMPVTQGGERLRVRVVSAEVVGDPVLERLAVLLGAMTILIVATCLWSL